MKRRSGPGISRATGEQAAAQNDSEGARKGLEVIASSLSAQAYNLVKHAPALAGKAAHQVGRAAVKNAKLFREKLLESYSESPPLSMVLSKAAQRNKGWSKVLRERERESCSLVLESNN